MIEGLAEILEISGNNLNALMLVFVRVTAAISLFPAFGEQVIPTRVRMMASIAFTLVVWPMVQPGLPAINGTLSQIGVLVVIEAGIGFLIGISVRLMIMALGCHHLTFYMVILLSLLNLIAVLLVHLPTTIKTFP